MEGTMSQTTKPLLQLMAETTDTDYWNDSCSIQELSSAIPNGAVGATTNPSIVYNVLANELDLWEGRIREIISDNPLFDEDEVAWQFIGGYDSVVAIVRGFMIPDPDAE